MAKEKSAKAGKNKEKGQAYRAREQQGKTAKARRVLRSLERGVVQKGWIKAGSTARPENTTRKKARSGS